MTNKRPLSVFVTSLLLCWEATTSQAAVYVPPDLIPGQSYHLAFVTFEWRDATSSSMADYNAFVQTEAERPNAFTETFGIDWFAIASTATVDARDNALVVAPVYMLNGLRLADGFADFWDGFLDWNFDWNQLSGYTHSSAFTGTSSSGFASNYPLGGPSPEATVGVTIANSFPSEAGDWIDFDRWLKDTTFGAPLYALSEVLSVPAVPEPGSLGLAIITSVAIIIARFRMK